MFDVLYLAYSLSKRVHLYKQPTSPSERRALFLFVYFYTSPARFALRPPLKEGIVLLLYRTLLCSASPKTKAAMLLYGDFS